MITTMILPILLISQVKLLTTQQSTTGGATKQYPTYKVQESDQWIAPTSGYGELSLAGYKSDLICPCRYKLCPYGNSCPLNYNYKRDAGGKFYLF